LRRDSGLASRPSPSAARAELIHVLRLPDFDRADAIGTFWGHPETRTFGELLIDLEEEGGAGGRLGIGEGDGAEVAAGNRGGGG
jgi:hypothetical protein